MQDKTLRGVLALALVAALLPAPAGAQSSSVTVIQNGTILTVTKGTIEKGSILIRDGKIAEVGKNIKTPAGATVIDASGMYVTPGLIDCHSHIAIEGSVNEGSVAVSSMVAVADVLDPTDIDIYRELAGGTTTSNVLHGSANPIGGLNAVIKHRWGKGAKELLFEGAPPGIKFALGENPKRSNFRPPAGFPQRYPNTRMGVMDVIRQAFIEAREYKKSWDAYNKRVAAGEKSAIPPRRNLKLEPLVEVLEGKRYVHSHGYRADELRQLLLLAEGFGFKVRTFQHVLEGYKIAKEMAMHGVGGSTFSDWWAYKNEAYDAIPYNAAIMTKYGVVVSINSDSAEEARHLNQEAAKTMKYGGLTATEALKLVTINPAIQLGIDKRVGSIEAGKDADLVIWDKHPLSVYAVAQKSLIDGAVYFDRKKDIEQRAEIAKEKKALLEKEKKPAEPAKKESGPGRPPGAAGKAPEKKPAEAKKPPMNAAGGAR
ncbi:MAG: amidohydrolase [Acidobacteria bacterium]|nr:amidohydrolase [Acidobacteriota bacterium]MBI3661830.1 amidohydrolase [Acidobacteriota bacterium]